MSIGRWIGILCLLLSLLYGYAAFNLPSFSDDSGASLLPNWVPVLMSAVCSAFAIILTVDNHRPLQEDESAEADKDNKRSGQSSWGVSRLLLLVAVVLVYVTLLGTLGLVLDTMLFILAAGVILGERDIRILLFFSVIGAFLSGYLICEVSGSALVWWP